MCLSTEKYLPIYLRFTIREHLQSKRKRSISLPLQLYKIPQSFYLNTIFLFIMPVAMAVGTSWYVLNNVRYRFALNFILKKKKFATENIYLAIGKRLQ